MDIPPCLDRGKGKNILSTELILGEFPYYVAVLAEIYSRKFDGTKVDAIRIDPDEYALIYCTNRKGIEEGFLLEEPGQYKVVQNEKVRVIWVKNTPIEIYVGLSREKTEKIGISAKLTIRIRSSIDLQAASNEFFSWIKKHKVLTERDLRDRFRDLFEDVIKNLISSDEEFLNRDPEMLRQIVKDKLNEFTSNNSMLFIWEIENVSDINTA